MFRKNVIHPPKNGPGPSKNGTGFPDWSARCQVPLRPVVLLGGVWIRWSKPLPLQLGLDFGSGLRSIAGCTYAHFVTKKYLAVCGFQGLSIQNPFVFLLSNKAVKIKATKNFWWGVGVGWPEAWSSWDGVVGFTPTILGKHPATPVHSGWRIYSFLWRGRYEPSQPSLLQGGRVLDNTNLEGEGINVGNWLEVSRLEGPFQAY